MSCGPTPAPAPDHRPSTRAELARYIDHTLLRPEATAGQVERLCEEALRFGFHAVCVNPIWVPRCVQRLAEAAAGGHGGAAKVVVVSVAGFPLGATTTAAKVLEAQLAVEQGAGEVDMVANLGALAAGDRNAVVRDISAVVDAVKARNEEALVKVILETAALGPEQIVLGCRCVAEGQADFVKTSTGFHPAGGARTEHVALLRRHATPIRIKAAGGIRDLGTALAMIHTGADRLGMSASVAVMESVPG